MILLQDLTSNAARARRVAMAAALVAAALMIARSLGGRAVDFPYILTAGRVWMAGADPYGPAFTAAGAGTLPAGAAAFAYPPNWWVIAVGLAALPAGVALIAWKLLNLVAAGAAGLLFVRSARRLQPDTPDWLPYLFLACLFSCGAMAAALRLGQTSILILLGLALLIDGLAFERGWRQVLGLVLLLLKPQIGLLFLLLALTRPRMRSVAARGCAATAAACLPTLFSLGLAGTFHSAANFLANLGSYDMLPWNWPTYMSGAPFLFAAIGLRLSPLAAVAIAWVVADIALRGRQTDSVTAFWLVSAGAVVAIIPLHLYDFVLCIPCVLLLPELRDRTTAGLVLLCAVLVWSANDLARALFLLRGGSEYAYWTATRLQAGLLTLAGMALLAAALRDGVGAPVPQGRVDPRHFLGREDEASATAE